MQIFHFALKPGGRLFLGGSESADETKGFFTPLDKKHRLYLRVASPRPSLPVPIGTETLLRVLQTQARDAPVVPGPGFARSAGAPFTFAPVASSPDERAALTDLHFRLLERLAPPSAVINDQQDIVHLSEYAGRFLQVVGGAPTNNVLRMVNPALSLDLRAAIFRAAETNEPVEVPGVAARLDGESKVVDLRVTPAPELAPGYLVVTFGARDPDVATAVNAPARLETENVMRLWSARSKPCAGTSATPWDATR